jgi:outer membrane protein
MHKRSLFLPLWLLLCPVAIHAQEIVSQQIEQLPDAPQPHAQAQQRTLALNSATTNSSDSLPPDSTGETLTRQQAEQLALKNNPRISVAALLALAQKQVVRETRSALLPTLRKQAASRLGRWAPPGFSITWAQGLTSLS